MLAVIRSPQPEIHLHGLCYDCKKRHEIVASPATWLARLSDWEARHRGHRIEFRSPKRVIPRGLDDRKFSELNDAPWWLKAFSPNADIKLAYASSAQYTIGLQATPLASSTTFVLGRESAAISNTSNLYLDYLVASGKITTGTSPTANPGTIQIWAYAGVDDTPTYPDVLDGTDSDETLGLVNHRDSGLVFLNSCLTTTTSNITYWFKPVSLATAYGGIVPKNHGLFVTHNTGVALNSTAGNHALFYTGAFATVA